jgi:hypothetical protein
MLGLFDESKYQDDAQEYFEKLYAGDAEPAAKPSEDDVPPKTKAAAGSKPGKSNGAAGADDAAPKSTAAAAASTAAAGATGASPSNGAPGTELELDEAEKDGAYYKRWRQGLEKELDMLKSDTAPSHLEAAIRSFYATIKPELAQCQAADRDLAQAIRAMFQKRLQDAKRPAA